MITDGVEQPQLRRGLWRDRDFMVLWAGQAISQVGSRITRDGLPLLAVLVLRASTVEMGFLAAAGSLPVFLVGPIAGAWVDRLRRRPVMIAADLGRALLLATIPTATWLGILHIWQLYVVIALVGVLSVLFEVAYAAYLPSLVERDHILEGNSKLALSDSAAELTGPGLAGLLVQLLTAPIAILLDAMSFLVSVISLSAIRKPEPPAPPVAERHPLRREIGEGLRAVAADPILRALAGSAAVLSFFGNFFATLYSLYALRVLGLGPAALGLTIAAGGAGSLLAALLAQPVVRRFGLGPTLIFSLLLGTGASLLIPLARGPALVAAGFLVTSQIIGDCLRSIHFINAISLRQAVAPDRLLGRVNAGVEALAGATAPVGAVVGGLLASGIGIRPTLAIAACGGLFAATWLWMSPVRRLWAHAPEQQVDGAPPL